MKNFFVLLSLALSLVYFSSCSKDNTFEKPGNNGTATCEMFCAGAQWGDVGTCVKGFNTVSNATVDCTTAVGLLTTPESVTCVCKK